MDKQSKSEKGRVVNGSGVRTPRDTVADVARAAGVSIATVSRVFSGATPVAEKTRRKVLDAAQRIGFRPNVAARALRTGKMETVAFVITAPHLLGEFYSVMMAGFHSALAARRLRVILSVVPADAEPRMWLQELVFAGWCGAVAVHVDLATDPNLLKALGIPVVLANHFPGADTPLAGINSVGFDNRMGLHQAVSHLAELGHREIAFLTGTPGNEDSLCREEGFRAGMQEAGLPIRESWIVPCSYEDGPESGGAGMDLLLADDSAKPTAVICGSDNIALGAMTAARRRGIAIPRDLSIVGFDDFFWAPYFNPPLTTVEHKGWDLGIAVGKTLLAHYENPGLAAETVVLPTRLIVRESTAPPPQRMR